MYYSANAFHIILMFTSRVANNPQVKTGDSPEYQLIARLQRAVPLEVIAIWRIDTVAFESTEVPNPTISRFYP